MNNNKNKKIEEILGSLDNPRRATAPDFFYTRLKARMENEMGISQARPKSWFLRPVFVATVFILVLLFNAFVFLQSDTGYTTSGDEDSIQTIAAEYNLSDGISEEVYK